MFLFMVHAFGIKSKNSAQPQIPKIFSYECIPQKPATNFREIKLVLNGKQAVSQNLIRILYQCAQATITKCHRIGGLDNRNLFTHSSGGQEAKTKVLSGFVSGETSLPGLQTAIFLSCFHIALCLCKGRERESSLVSLPLLIRTPVPLDQGPTLMISFNPNYLPKGLVFKYSQVVGQSFNI